MPEPPPVYVNRYPELLAAELDEAAGIELPIGTAPGALFDEIAACGRPLIYVVTEDMELRICERMFRSRLSHHSVLAGGAQVLAAGEVSLIVVDDTTKYVLRLDDRSGHYLPAPSCVRVALDLFGGHGFVVLTDGMDS